MAFLGVGNAGVESLLININIFIAANILKYFGSLVRKKNFTCSLLVWMSSWKQMFILGNILYCFRYINGDYTWTWDSNSSSTWGTTFNGRCPISSKFLRVDSSTQKPQIIISFNTVLTKVLSVVEYYYLGFLYLRLSHQ